jgi:5-methylcytosine-specific restriction endonuclease McrA
MTAPRPRAPGAACKDVGGRIDDQDSESGGGRRQLRRTAGLTWLCIETGQLVSVDQNVLANLHLLKVAGSDVSPQDGTGHPDLTGRLWNGQQASLPHADKGYRIGATSNRLPQLLDSGPDGKLDTRVASSIAGRRRVTERQAPYVADNLKRQRKNYGAAKLRLRFRVLERDNFRCHWCGVPAREARIVIDHVMPFSKGGADDPSNYVSSCEPCNGGKGDLILEPRDGD